MDVRDAFEGSGPYGGNNPNSSVTAIIDNFFEFNISGTVHRGYYHDADQIMMGDASAAAAANDDVAYESRRNTSVASRKSQRQCRVMLHRVQGHICRLPAAVHAVLCGLRRLLPRRPHERAGALSSARVV